MKGFHIKLSGLCELLENDPVVEFIEFVLADDLEKAVLQIRENYPTHSILGTTYLGEVMKTQQQVADEDKKTI